MKEIEANILKEDPMERLINRVAGPNPHSAAKVKRKQRHPAKT